MIGSLTQSPLLGFFASQEAGFGHLPPDKRPTDNRIVDLRILGNLPLLDLIIFDPVKGFLDSRGNPVPPPSEAGTLYLRHTITGTVNNSIYAGSNDNNKLARPTWKGLVEAFKAGRTLRAMGCRPDVIVRPNLERTRTTALLIALACGHNGIPFNISEAVERGFGIFDGESHSTLPREFQRDLRSLSRTSFHETTGVEPLGHFLARGAITLTTLALMHDSVMEINPNPFNIIVGHGGKASYVVGAILAQVVKNSGQLGERFIAVPANQVAGMKGQELPYPYRDINAKHLNMPIGIEFKLKPNQGVWLPKDLIDLVRIQLEDDRYSFAPLAKALDNLGVDDIPNSYMKIIRDSTGRTNKTLVSLFEGLESGYIDLSLRFDHKVWMSTILNQDWNPEYLASKLAYSEGFTEAWLPVWMIIGELYRHISR